MRASSFQPILENARDLVLRGITTTDDLRALAEMNLYGAIVGRVLYTGDMNVTDALKAVRNQG